MTNDKTVTMSREQLERWTTGRVSLSHLAEMRAILAAPVVERQVPVAWQRESKMEEGRWFFLPDDDVEEAIRLGYEVRKLYASPPAPVAVVLPERADENDDSSGNDPTCWYPQGWNACLDKVKELNK